MEKKFKNHSTPCRYLKVCEAVQKEQGMENPETLQLFSVLFSPVEIGLAAIDGLPYLEGKIGQIMLDIVIEKAPSSIY